MQEFGQTKESGSTVEFLEYQLPDEYVSDFEEFSDYSPKKSLMEQKNEKTDSFHEKMKKLKKMAYLISASVATVTVMSSAAEGLDMERGREKYGFIEIDDYTSVGAYDGGVLSVQFAKDSWGLVDFDGKEILRDDGDLLIMGNPNDSGYAVFRDDEGIFVTDKSGKRVLEINENPIFARITEDVLFTVTERNGLRDFKYRDLDGKLIYVSGAHSVPDLGAYHLYEGDIFIGATAFIDGHAFCCDGDGMVRIERSGTVKRIASWTNLEKAGRYVLDEAPVMILSGFSDDFILGRYVNSPLDSALINLETNEVWANYVNLYRKLLNETEYRYSSIIGENWSNTYYGIDGFSYPFSGYYVDGAEVFNNGPYVVRKFRITGSDREFFTMLTDYSKEDYYNEILGAVCYHDEIYPSAGGIYLAADGGKYFYIDRRGKKLTDREFVQASAFTTQGYALVCEEDGTTYLIDQNFKKIKEFSDITEIDPECKGNGIVVTRDGKKQILVSRD